MKKLILFPFNGNAIEALDCISNEYECIGFVDDNRDVQGNTRFGIDVHNRELINRYKEAYILAVPGGPESFHMRKEAIDSLQVSSNRFAVVIHSSAQISNYSSIGYNTLIMAGVVLTAESSVGNHVCILPNSVVHHHSVIEDYTLMGSGVIVAGHTKIGSNCYLGSGSRIKNGLVIGRDSLIGMGSVVLKNCSSGSKLVGVPARSI